MPTARWITIYLIIALAVLVGGFYTTQAIQAWAKGPAPRDNHLRDIPAGNFMVRFDISPRILREHVVRLNRNGYVIDPDKTRLRWPVNAWIRPVDSSVAIDQIRNMLDQATAHAAKKGETRGGKPLVKLLVHVHGGLNTFGDTDERVFDLADSILNDPTDWQYPIFFSWPSNAPGSWAEHAFAVREGRRVSLWTGIPSSAFIILPDFLGAFANYPVTFWYQAVNESNRIMSAWGWTGLLSQGWKDADRVPLDPTGKLRPSMDPDGVTRIEGVGKPLFNRSHAYPATLKLWARNASQVVTFPVRFTAGTIVNSTLAATMWDNMKRRTRNVFHPPALFDGGSRESERRALAGGDFFRLLLERVRNDTAHAWDVTLVGHSMGSFVVNQALTIYRKDWLETGAAANIVYMAAACSIEEGLAAVAPLLQGRPANPSRPANFYNLTLNRVAEVSETHVAGFAPTGSLLVSIDQHLEKPNHPLGRTLGSEVNVLATAPRIRADLEGIAGRAHFKAFDYRPGNLPGQHGDFNLLKFWKRETWRLGESGIRVRQLGTVRVSSAYLPSP